MPLPPLVINNAARLHVRLTGGLVQHPTSGYRLWRGHFESIEPIVALAVSVTGRNVKWVRTSHRGTQTVETSILFSPFDDEGARIQVYFGVADSGINSQTVVESIQTQPAPNLRRFHTGELVDVASVGADPTCELKALFLARRDVASVRNGVWHARGDAIANVQEPWRTILTYGRTGEFETAGD